MFLFTVLKKDSDSWEWRERERQRQGDDKTEK